MITKNNTAPTVVQEPDSSRLTFHPLLTIFPEMDQSAFAEFVADIKEHGIHEAVWTYKGQLLDGRNRWLACQELGIECPQREYMGKESELLAFVLSANLQRRHLDSSQRAMIAAKIANMRQGERTDLQPSPNLEKVSIDAAAKLLNVATGSVGSARKVIAKAEPEIIKAVEQGDLAVSVAARVVAYSAEIQKQVVAKTKKGKRTLPRVIDGGIAVITDGPIEQAPAPSGKASGAAVVTAAKQEAQAPTAAEATTTAEADDAEDVEFESYDRDCPKRKGVYIVTLEVAASRLKTIQKQAEQTFGEMVLSVEKKEVGGSRADLLAEAESQVESAHSTVEEIRDELQSWHDNLPENFQFGMKAEELNEAIFKLDELANSLDGSNFDFQIEIPGMC
jgi:ParB-like chromosome segregation protein Spo0J